jgi:hypothetical protein
MQFPLELMFFTGAAAYGLHWGLMLLLFPKE